MALEYRALSFLLLSVCLMFADGRFNYLDQVRFALGFVTTPVYWIANFPAQLTVWADDVLVSRTRLLTENSQLKEELLVARRDLQLLESLARENSRLLELREASEVIEAEVLPAEIINESPDANSKRVLINKGALDGVFLGQPMLDANGVMGQVDEVLPFTSWVLLITDFRHVTPVEVNRNGERALARGSRGTASELQLEYVTRTQDMKAGDLLVSSGMGQVYPKNYPVAEIVSVYAEPGLEFVTVRARPLAQMARTRHVVLIFEQQSAFAGPERVAGQSKAGENGLTEDAVAVTEVDQPGFSRPGGSAEVLAQTGPVADNLAAGTEDGLSPQVSPQEDPAPEQPEPDDL